MGGMNATRTILTQVTWRIPQMDCPVEESEIRALLARVEGVGRLQFRLIERTLTVQAQPQALPQAEAALRAAGFEPERVMEGGASPASPAPAAGCGGSAESAGCGCGMGREAASKASTVDASVPSAASPVAAPTPWAAAWRWLRTPPGPVRIGAALALALGAELGHAFLPQALRPWGMALALLAVVLAGWSTYLKGLQALRRGRLSISALMGVAVTGAFAIGQWPEAAMVMALYALAEHLEARAVDRARGAIARLLDMAPAEVEVQDAQGQWGKRPAAQVLPGAVVRVKPGARLALDGVVLQGRSAVNQAPVTGESLPVDKGEGDTVYAGSLNESGVLLVRVSAAAHDTQLARIIEAVEQAHSARAPMQAAVDRFAAYYTPAVLALALAVAVLGPLLAGWGWQAALYKALVMLVIACPCALVIATPATIVSALSRAAQLGLLVKGGVYLEGARRLRTVAFDKTGTLTTGQPALVAQEWLLEASADAPAPAPELGHRWAQALAAHSDHPVAQAIARGLAAQGQAGQGQDEQGDASGAGAGCPGACDNPAPPRIDVANFRDLPGQGVQALVQGQSMRLVGPRALAQPLPERVQARLQEQQNQGRSVSLLVRDGSAGDSEVLALYAVADTLKPQAREAVAALHALGVQTVMLSGDHAQAVAACAQAAGVAQAHGELLPSDKLTWLKTLQANGPVAMVGDGINDAPALAAADIGIAVGHAGADVAMEAADVVLMNGALARIVTLVRLSHHTHRVLVRNIALALGIKIAFLALAVAGLASMWMAVFADVGASLMVIALGLRLQHWREL